MLCYVICIETAPVQLSDAMNKGLATLATWEFDPFEFKYVVFLM